MAEPDRFRYRIEFEKLSPMRFTGHLDLYRTWERTLRRAGLPLAYSQGYSPHPRIHLACALPLGCTSDCELADVWLEQGWEPEAILQALRRSTPPGLAVRSVRFIEYAEPALQRQVRSAEYRVDVDPGGLTSVEESVRALLSASSLIRERRGKSYDLRPLVETLALESGESGQASLMMRLAAREAATGRPEEVLQALGLDPMLHPVRRIGLILASEEAFGQPTA